MFIKQTSLQPIIEILQKYKTLSPSEIALELDKSKVIIHKYLKALYAQGIVRKIGSGTHTKYTLTTTSHQSITEPKVSLPFALINVIEHNFTKFAPNGARLSGYDGFIQRCSKRRGSILTKAEQFVAITKHIDSLQNDCGLLNVTEVFRQNIDNSQIDELYYADQYKWMDFGRGKLAEITFYAKQSQMTALIKESIELVWHKLSCLIIQIQPDALVLTPHSIYRKNQLLTILKHYINKTNLPYIKLVKYFPNKIPIPQKSLKTRAQRIENARETILIDAPHTIQKYKKVLLIDDLVGSGATLNQTGIKLKQQGVQTVIAFAFVGNANLSYDVINEV